MGAVEGVETPQCPALSDVPRALEGELTSVDWGIPTPVVEAACSSRRHPGQRWRWWCIRVGGPWYSLLSGSYPSKARFLYFGHCKQTSQTMDRRLKLVSLPLEADGSDSDD